MTAVFACPELYDVSAGTYQDQNNNKKNTAKQKIAADDEMR